jgi:predicted RNA binding protein YcfA (HicA-like mRNA interferase family)
LNAYWYQIIKTLKKAGFTYAPKQGKGSHVALYKIDSNGKKMLTIVPKRKEVPRGTLLAILQQTELTKSEFLKLLGEK